MAQQDTGLGWSAKDTWLVSQANVEIANISTIGGPSFPNQPINHGISINDFETNSGFQYWVYNGGGVYYESYMLSDPSYSDVVIFGFVSGNDKQVVIVTTSPTFKVYTADKNAVGYSTFQTVSGSGVRDATTGLYYWWISTGSRYVTLSQNLPQFASLRAGLDAVQVISTTFNKTEAGAAVACVAKWKTDNNVLYRTPVLISSESEYTDMTSSDTSYSLAKLNVRNDGIQFYMSFFDIVDKDPQTTLEVADLSMFKLDLNQVFNLIAQSGMANIQVTETVDPFEDFPYNGEDAGEINPDPQDDDVDFDDLPTKSFATAGFCRIFNPDVSDLNDLASYMWTDQNFLQTVINHLKQILENPIEAIISLSMVPVQPQVGSSKVPVNVMFINTGVSMRPVTSQFVTVDCGTTVLQECYGGALDYNPYTRVQIYLPYIGIVQLDTDEVMAKTLHLQYHIDVVTGICCAEIKADNKLLYSFSGHCAVSQPITSADFSSYLNAAVAAAKVAVGVATGMASTTAGAAAAEIPPALPSKAQTSSALVPLQPSGAIGPHLGSPGMSGSHAWTDFSDIADPQSNGGVSWGELAKPGNANTVASAMGGKMVVQHSGGFSGNSGYLAKRRPYLIIIRPRIANPRNYAQHFGRTSMEYLNLGSCSGYTKVQSVHLSGFDATNPELSEISSLLKGGVLM